ncbi:hypothetical protein ACQR1Y_11605 [Bradyrhizobium sp. HKCCYLRH3099]|uniref:hypothetical protein n=1 Tax=unclassified Bradyrhizobium TaxID=2631580 RepID=UPI003EBE043E
MSSTATQNTAQARIVGEGVTRYDWLIAFSRMSLRTLALKNRDVAMAAAMRLVEYLAKGAGQCRAKRTTIAGELGISERHLNRGLQILETHGWIRRQRGGPDDPVIITLVIPAEGADIHRFGSKKADGLQDNMLSRKDAALTGQKSTSYRTQIEALQDTQDVPSNEQVEQEEQSAPLNGARTDRVETEGPCHSNGKSAPDGAPALDEIIATLPAPPSASELSLAADVTDEDFAILEQNYPEHLIGDLERARAALSRALYRGCDVIDMAHNIEHLENLPSLATYCDNYALPNAPTCNGAVCYATLSSSR